VQIRIHRAEPRDEGRIETHEPVAAAQILEGEIVLELEFADGHPRIQIEWACASERRRPEEQLNYRKAAPLIYDFAAALLCADRRISLSESPEKLGLLRGL